MKNLLEDFIDTKKSANINNTNNNNNNNNTNNKLTTNTLHLVSDEHESTSSFSLGKEAKEEELLDSKPKRKVAVKIAPEWTGIKLDLYCNGNNKDGSSKMKLNV